MQTCGKYARIVEDQAIAGPQKAMKICKNVVSKGLLCARKHQHARIAARFRRFLGDQCRRQLIMKVRYLPQINILGIESSCDETAAAVVRDGRQILSGVVASQLATHAKYGGVVPELASREHLRAIVPVVREALANADVSLDDLSAIGVTQGPGLVGSLLVGITYAKALCFARKLPLIGVNHVEGHIHSVLLEH